MNNRAAPATSSLQAKLAEVVAIALTPRRYTRPSWEERLLVNGRRRELIHQAVAWEFGDGPPVLLTHGWEGRGAQLGCFVEPLLRREMGIIVVDGPGHGASAAEYCHWPDYADALIDAAAGRTLAAVVAHSLGGLAAGFGLAGGLAFERLALLAAPRSVIPEFERFARWRNLPVEHLPLLHTAVEQRIGAPLRFLDLAHHASQLVMPALVIHDRNDPIVPFDVAQDLGEALADAEVTISQGLGHRGMLYDPDCVEKVVAFVTREVDR